MSHFLITYGNFHRKRSDTIRTVNNIIFRGIIAQLGKRSTYIDLNTLRHTLADFHIVLTTHILLNIGSKIVTSNTDRIIRNNTTQ